MYTKKIIYLIAVMTTVVFSFYAYTNERAAVLAAAEDFFALSASGSAEAEMLLAPDLKGGQPLRSALAETTLFSLKDTQFAGFSSLGTATVSVRMQIGGSERDFRVEMVRLDGAWKISGFPDLILLSPGYVAASSEREAVLLDAKGHTYRLKAQELLPPQEGQAGPAVGLEGELIYFSPLEQVEAGKVLTITPEKLEGEGQGNFALSSELVLFRPEGDTVEPAKFKDLILGMEEVKLFLQEGEVEVVMLPQDFNPHLIRVLISPDISGGTVHSDIRLAAETSLILEEKISGEKLSIPNGGVLSFSSDGEAVNVTFADGKKRTFNHRLYIKAENEGKVDVTSIRRGNPPFIPSYRGRLEVKAVQGGLLLVNEVPLEEYLFSVVPSEMQVSFGEEPLKAQAVAARTYAISSVLTSGITGLSAHVFDTTGSQVYNNVPEQPASTKAVRQTAGLVLLYGEEFVDARFFSTSSGYTANFHEVWAERDTHDFPSRSIPYLRAQQQLRQGTAPAVETSNGSREFFGSAAWDAYDHASPWFRWQVEMTRSELEESIEQNLSAQQKRQPGSVLTLVKGEWQDLPVQKKGLGKLQDLAVIRRGAGGNIMELKVAGDKNSYLLRKEYTIRFTLRPVLYGDGRDILLRRHDGSTVSNYMILPSSFFTLSIQRNGQGSIENVSFQGGGNGHGVGMSQWGARGLAQDGNKFDAILTHYYPGSKMSNLYE